METRTGTLKIWPQKRKPQMLLTLNNQTALPETVSLARHNSLGGTMKVDNLAVRNTKWTGLFNTIRRKYY